MSKSKKIDGIPVSYFTMTGGKKGTINLPKEIFGQKPNKVLLAQAVRVFLANQRSAKARTKGRGEIARTKKKVYRQKGTGGARHGSRSAPIYVGGGIAHGPRGIENYKLDLPKKMRKLALVSALSAKVGEGSVSVVDLEKTGPKTSNLSSALKNAGVRDGVIVHTSKQDLFRAGRNIIGVRLVPAYTLTAYDVLSGSSLVLTKDALEIIKARLGTGSKEEKL